MKPWKLHFWPVLYLDCMNLVVLFTLRKSKKYADDEPSCSMLNTDLTAALQPAEFVCCWVFYCIKVQCEHNALLNDSWHSVHQITAFQRHQCRDWLGVNVWSWTHSIYGKHHFDWSNCDSDGMCWMAVCVCADQKYCLQFVMWWLLIKWWSSAFLI